MRAVANKGLCTLAFAVCFASYSLASPLSSRLLSLVPPGSDVVAGFENHTSTGAHGRLLLTTHNNRLDLGDWEALAGVDSQRIFEEIVEVAATDDVGNLSEHLLLVAGRFDRERIFRSLEDNHVESTEFQGQRILIINPFARERGDMLDVRWLVILENRIGMFGTPHLVQQALERYRDHSVPDSVLEERLSPLRSDVTSWNVLSRSPRKGSAFSFAQPHSAWAELQQDTDVLMIGTRFGSKVRIDFSLHAGANRGADFFTRKAAFFTDAMASGPNQERVSPAASQRRVEKFSVGANHVEGSVELSSRPFDAWRDDLLRQRVAPAVPEANGN